MHEQHRDASLEGFMRWRYMEVYQISGCRLSFLANEVRGKSRRRVRCSPGHVVLSHEPQVMWYAPWASVGKTEASRDTHSLAA